MDKDDVQWYERHHPRGSMTGILSLLLAKYRAVSETTPADYAEIAAKALAEEHGV